jgi:5-methylcytosine-specific restriction endonuclease McrA
MKKTDRQKVFDKYGGKCAYCGCELKKGWNVDHIEPAFHNWSDEDVVRILKEKSRGAHSIDNYNPSCPRCNKWKSTYSIEDFRREISMQVERLKRDSSNFRMALDYGMIQPTENPVTFYFEQQR